MLEKHGANPLERPYKLIDSGKAEAIEKAKIIIGQQLPENITGGMLVNLAQMSLQVVLEPQKGKPPTIPHNLNKVRAAYNFLQAISEAISRKYSGVTKIDYGIYKKDDLTNIEKLWSDVKESLKKRELVPDAFDKLFFAEDRGIFHQLRSEQDTIAVAQVAGGTTVERETPSHIAKLSQMVKAIKTQRPEDVPLHPDNIGKLFSERPYALGDGFDLLMHAAMETLKRINDLATKRRGFDRSSNEMLYEANKDAMMLVLFPTLSWRDVKTPEMQAYMHVLNQWKRDLIEGLIGSDHREQVVKFFIALSSVRNDAGEIGDFSGALAICILGDIATNPFLLASFGDSLTRLFRDEARQEGKDTLYPEIVLRFLESKKPHNEFMEAQENSLMMNLLLFRLQELIKASDWQRKQAIEITTALEKTQATLGFSRSHARLLERNLKASSSNYDQEQEQITQALEELHQEILRGFPTKPTGTLKSPRTYIYTFKDRDAAGKIFGSGSSVELYGANDSPANPVLHFTLHCGKDMPPIYGSLDMSTAITELWSTAQPEDFSLLHTYISYYVLSIFADLAKRSGQQISDAERIAEVRENEISLEEEEKLKRDGIRIIPPTLTIDYSKDGLLTVERILDDNTRLVGVKPATTFTNFGRQYIEAYNYYLILLQQSAPSEEIEVQQEECRRLLDIAAKANYIRLEELGFSDKEIGNLYIAKDPLTGREKRIETWRVGYDRRARGKTTPSFPGTRTRVRSQGSSYFSRADFYAGNYRTMGSD